MSLRSPSMAVDVTSTAFGRMSMSHRLPSGPPEQEFCIIHTGPGTKHAAACNDLVNTYQATAAIDLLSGTACFVNRFPVRNASHREPISSCSDLAWQTEGSDGGGSSYPADCRCAAF